MTGFNKVGKYVLNVIHTPVISKTEDINYEISRHNLVI